VNTATSEFDYVVVGGGTAGVIVAARLAENPDAAVCLVEAGPSDEGVPEILQYRRWREVLDSKYGHEFTIVPQKRGNSLIRYPRARVLGGCSSHNSVIALRAFDQDMLLWEELGAAGWGPAGTSEFFDRVFERVHVMQAPPVNTGSCAFVDAGLEAGFPLIKMDGSECRSGVGWLHLNVDGETRQSSSVAYLHPVASAPANLSVRTESRADRLRFDAAGRAIGVETTRGYLGAREEVILCCGAFESPRLLMLSGVGPASDLERLGIEVVLDLPGVGAHLIDHAEAVVVWEASRPVPTNGTQHWETALFGPLSEAGVPEVMVMFGTEWLFPDTNEPGYPPPQVAHALSAVVSVARTKSEGTVSLLSTEPEAPLRIDPCYFSDPDGYDEQALVTGIDLCRRLAETPTLREWTERELAPGPQVQSEADLRRYATCTSITNDHPAGTCRMGAVGDAAAVVDPALRVRGVEHLRVADASIFPAMIGVNICITTMMIGEKCAALVGAGARS
jgi:choline oxidase